MGRFALRERPYRLHAFAEPTMRMSNDARKAVVFIGIGPSNDFTSLGTAFFASWKGRRYVVTAHHVIHPIADAPFSIRINGANGAPSFCIAYDALENAKDYPWFSPKDETVDLAIMPFNGDIRAAGGEFKILPEEMFLSDDALVKEDIGIGNIAYSVGLFRLHSGKSRNLPVVHTGNIALMAGEEALPVKDWRVEDETKARTLRMDAHLVEMLSLEGLSGSPVFARSTISLEDWPVEDGSKQNLLVSDGKFLLMGIWQGAWKGEPDPVLARQAKADGWKVPIGVGAVTPAQKLIDLLESEPVAAEREDFHKRMAERGMAKPD